MRYSSKTKGFTIIEVLVVIPIVVIIIGVIVGFIVSMVGTALTTSQRGNSTYQVQTALTRIEQDIRITNEILATTVGVESPQGVNSNFNGSDQFSDPTKFLMLKQFATTGNPYTSNRSLVYYKDLPNPCGGATEKLNTVVEVQVVYFVYNKSLIRRTIVPLHNRQDIPNVLPTCNNASAWQKSSCDANSVKTSDRCPVEDEILVKGGVTGIAIAYFKGASDTTPTTNPAEATTAKVDIITDNKISGTNISYSGGIRASKLNTPQAKAQVPPQPTVNLTLTGPKTIQATWSGAQAAFYDVSYSINDSSCSIQPLSNTINTSYVIPNTNHDDRVYICVTAKNLAGNSTVAKADAAIPLWSSVPLQSGWLNDSVNMGRPYWPDFGFTMTPNGEVHLTGLIANKAGGFTGTKLIATLPPGYRPDRVLLFDGFSDKASRKDARIDIYPDGNIYYNSRDTAATITNFTYVTLNNIHFMPSGGCTMTNVPLQSPWQAYGGSFGSDVLKCKDSWNVLHTQGLTYVSAAYPVRSTIGTLAGADFAPPKFYLFPAVDHNLYSTIQVYPSGSNGIIGSRDFYGGWHAVNSRYHAATTPGWVNLPMQNGWLNYGAGYNDMQYLKQGRIVSLRGAIKSGAGSVSNIGVLPAGFRPARNLLFTAPNVKTNPSAEGAASITIQTDGYVIAANLLSNIWLSLDNITFIAEQ